MRLAPGGEGAVVVADGSRAPRPYAAIAWLILAEPNLASRAIRKIGFGSQISLAFRRIVCLVVDQEH